jgi:hypothetical protein
MERRRRRTDNADGPTPPPTHRPLIEWTAPKFQTDSNQLTSIKNKNERERERERAGERR